MSDAGAVSDAELLARHRAGDREAFGEIVRRHSDRMWAIALRTLGDPEEAADAVQDAVLSAFRAASRFRGDSAVSTWLHRVVVNACLDRMRRKAARPAAPLPTDELVPMHDPDVAESRETRLDVVAALLTLPPEQRAALVLVDMEGYSVEEAARILAVAPGTVKSRCARGRARLLPLVRHLRPGHDGNPTRAGRVQSSDVIDGPGEGR